MKLKKRIIFTLLYCSGNFVLSRNFRLQNIGNYEWLIKNYNFENISFYIDELIILDVSRDNRYIREFSNLISDLSKNIFVPITAGGGIQSIEDAKILLNSGADKIILNTGLFKNKKLIPNISSIYGKQCIVGSIDLVRDNNNYVVVTENGTKRIGVLEQCIKTYKINEIVGEIYVNSIDKDGTGNGLDLDLAKIIFNLTTTPFIIAGGIGKIDDIVNSLKEKYINAVSTAHLLNFIGNSLQKVREKSYENYINIAKWNDISQLRKEIKINQL